MPTCGPRWPPTGFHRIVVLQNFAERRSAEERHVRNTCTSIDRDLRSLDFIPQQFFSTYLRKQRKSNLEFSKISFLEFFQLGCGDSDMRDCQRRAQAYQINSLSLTRMFGALISPCAIEASCNPLNATRIWSAISGVTWICEILPSTYSNTSLGLFRG